MSPKAPARRVELPPTERALPDFVPPMLAKPGVPFNSTAHLFEVKWDGTRTLAFIEKDSYRLVNRRRIAMTARYPEFAFLAALPAGTILDGEMVVLRNGKPDFGLLQSREHTSAALKVRTLSKSTPATLVAFDLLYEDFRPLLSLPFVVRRQRLELLLRRHGGHHLVLSEGVVGPGMEFFAEACRQGLEGVVAKRLDSPYLPKRRTDAWVKIKRGATVQCAIIGFLPSGSRDFKSLILAAEEGGALRYVGKVGTGIDQLVRNGLNDLLWSRLRARPLLPCKVKGKWVEPGLYCTVRYMERTAGGELRMPVFESLHVEEPRG